MSKKSMRKASEIIKKISHRLRLAIGESTAVQVEAGYLNDDLSLTEKGRIAVLEKLAETDEISEHLTDLAKADIEEAKKECENKSKED